MVGQEQNRTEQKTNISVSLAHRQIRVSERKRRLLHGDGGTDGRGWGTCRTGGLVARAQSVRDLDLFRLPRHLSTRRRLRGRRRRRLLPSPEVRLRLVGLCRRPHFVRALLAVGVRGACCWQWQLRSRGCNFARLVLTCKVAIARRPARPSCSDYLKTKWYGIPVWSTCIS